ncbi:ABC transporter substrate-binding protein [Streptomyces sp. WMMC500]|uniref:ABC transporter substrate-binding protein n=1 Tax=Streptomyces sp. WMMC500 TaxID=3015154 RepID=UPI00248BC483|nr:ABC transporter substrate-binding protein [Streptomyces sp. WMMC500]WBB64390.1 ABC transporter substrate-binding protein [Streptomyces sp. WMMC500]
MRRFVTGLAVAATLVAAAACGSSADEGSEDGTTGVKVGVIPIVDVAPIYLGEKKGFFKSRGIELTLEAGQGGAAIVPGVVSGQFQFGFSNTTSLMVAQNQNIPVQGVVNGVASTGKQGEDFGAIMVSEDSPIRSAGDLAGKKVAVNTLKNIGDTSVRESVRKAGGDPEGVEFTEIGFPQMPAALANGDVDAAWVVEPAQAAIKAEGGRVIASNYVDVAPDLTVAMYFTSQKLAEENPELVAEFTAAMKESLAYADAHPDEVRQILTTYTEIDGKILDGMILPKWPAEPDKASLERLAELGVADGVLTEAPDMGKLVP